MSAVKKAFKAIKKSKILKTIAIAAAVYYVGGLAMESFAAPTAGTGMQISEQGFSALGESAIGEGISVTPVGDALGASVSETIGAGAETAMAAPGITSGAELGLIPEGGAIPSLAGGAGTGAGAGGGGIVKGAMGWMQQNPMATMMLGQGVSGAVQASEMEKAQEREDARMRNRGLFGVDYKGEYQGGDGIVSSRMRQPAVAEQQVAGVAAPTVAKRPIKRNDLTKLNQQNLVAKRTGV